MGRRGRCAMVQGDRQDLPPRGQGASRPQCLQDQEIHRFNRLSLNPGDTDAILSTCPTTGRRRRITFNGLSKITQKRCTPP